MVDYSKIHEVIAETNEGILLAEYQPEYRTDREYQSEADLENQLISDLVNHLNYERLNIHTPEELLANAKVQIEKLNKVTFTNAEWDRFVVEYLDCPNEGLVEKTRKIQENYIYDFVFDDGRIKNIFILDKKNIHNNSMQVINQVTQVGSHTNRYDVTILVNGEVLKKLLNKFIDIVRKASIVRIPYTSTFRSLLFLMEPIHATLQIRQLKIKIIMSSLVNGQTVKIKRFMT